jgi:glycine hydroxymethyltransferase
MKSFGQAYAGQIVANAKALGRALTDHHLQVEAEAFGFTESHQIALKVSRKGSAKEIARRLAENNIIVNYNMLPGDQDPKDPSGLRIGVQELTRFGMKEKEMGEVAAYFAAVLQGKKVKEEVIGLKSRFQELHYA